MTTTIRQLISKARAATTERQAAQRALVDATMNATLPNLTVPALFLILKERDKAKRYKKLCAKQEVYAYARVGRYMIKHGEHDSGSNAITGSIPSVSSELILHAKE